MLLNRFNITRDCVCRVRYERGFYWLEVVKTIAGSEEAVIRLPYKTFEEAEPEYEVIAGLIQVLEEKNVQKYLQLPFEMKHFALDDERYSHAFAVYSLLPKHETNRHMKVGKSLNPLEREFVLGGQRFRLTVSPAKIRRPKLDHENNPVLDAKGQRVLEWYDVLPGLREKYVEQALIKMACHGYGFGLGDRLGVAFCLADLKKELKTTGHEVNHGQLVESLQILTRCTLLLELVHNDAEARALERFEGATFPEMLRRDDLSKLEDIDTVKLGTKKTKIVIVFNSLVRKSIIENVFKRYNYELSMRFTTYIAGYLFDRMSLHFSQASPSTPYKIYLSSLLEACAIKPLKFPSQDMMQVTKGLEELKTKGILESYETKRKVMKGGQTEYELKLFPSVTFCNEIRVSNGMAKVRRMGHRQPLALQAGQATGKRPISPKRKTDERPTLLQS